MASLRAGDTGFITFHVASLSIDGIPNMANVEVTGAARLYRAASVWTAGLGLFTAQVLSTPARPRRYSTKGNRKPVMPIAERMSIVSQGALGSSIVSRWLFGS